MTCVRSGSAESRACNPTRTPACWEQRKGAHRWFSRRRWGQGHCLLFASRRQWLGRLGDSSPVSAAGPSIARLPDRAAAGDRSGEIRSNRPDTGLAPGVTVVDGHAVVRNVDPAESEIARTTVAQLRENYRLPEVAKTVPDEEAPRTWRSRANGRMSSGEPSPGPCWSCWFWKHLSPTALTRNNSPDVPVADPVTRRSCSDDQKRGGSEVMAEGVESSGVLTKLEATRREWLRFERWLSAGSSAASGNSQSVPRWLWRTGRGCCQRPCGLSAWWPWPCLPSISSSGSAGLSIGRLRGQGGGLFPRPRPAAPHGRRIRRAGADTFPLRPGCLRPSVATPTGAFQARLSRADPLGRIRAGP